ncbi:FAD-dependent oxidoreductase [Desulfovulcanus sp.]
MRDSIGIILCTCGSTLEDKIDFTQLEKCAEKLESVTIIKKTDNLCKNPEKILNEFNGKVDRILFACCSERSSLTFNEDRIAKLLDHIGLDNAMYETANIREQCAWIHEDKEKTTAKAMDLILMAYEKLKTNSKAYKFNKIKQNVLVVGGGVTGLSSALSLAELGVDVTLIEEKPNLGGHACQIPFLWQSEGSPSVCTSECVIPVINRDVLFNDAIKIMTNSEVIDAEKVDGNFHVKIEKKAEFVNPDLCVSCGKCAEVCPIEIPNKFELDMKKRKAIDKDFPLAMPDSYHIISSACNMCGECAKICPTKAIDLNAKSEITEQSFGSVVIATGFNTHDMTQFEKLNYKQPNVITLMEFERLIANRFNGRPPMSIVFVLCQKDEVGYCSRLCCSIVAKHTFRLSQFFMGTEVTVLYKNLRTTGRAGEIFRKTSEERGVEFVRAEVERIEGDEWLNVITDKGEFEADLVVLAEPLIPSPLRLVKMFGLQTDEFGFPLEFQPKVIRPLESYVDRVFVAGTAKGFKDVQESIESGSAAALKAYQALKAKEQKFVSKTIEDKCSGCGMCVPVCPHSAITIKGQVGAESSTAESQEQGDQHFAASSIKIDPAFCKGCGLCYTTCPSKAIQLVNLEDYQILKMVDTAFKNAPEGEPRILAFLCYWCSYGAGDLMGPKGVKVPESFRSIRIRCSASLNPDVITEILFKNKADAILIAGCPPKNCHHLWGNYIQDKRVKFLQETLKEFGVSADKLRWEYIGVTGWGILAKILKYMDKEARKLGS